MLVHELEERLRHVLPFQKRTHSAQTVFAVGMGRRARFFQGVTRVLAAQVQQALQHAHAGNAPALQHRLRPTRASAAKTPHLDEQILGPVVDGGVLAQLTVVQLYLVSAIEGTLFVFFNIAEAACLPRVVSKEQLPAATAQNRRCRPPRWRNPLRPGAANHAPS